MGRPDTSWWLTPKDWSVQTYGGLADWDTHRSQRAFPSQRRWTRGGIELALEHRTTAFRHQERRLHVLSSLIGGIKTLRQGVAQRSAHTVINKINQETRTWLRDVGRAAVNFHQCPAWSKNTHMHTVHASDHMNGKTNMREDRPAPCWQRILCNILCVHIIKLRRRLLLLALYNAPHLFFNHTHTPPSTLSSSGSIIVCVCRTTCSRGRRTHSFIKGWKTWNAADPSWCQNCGGTHL